MVFNSENISDLFKDRRLIFILGVAAFLVIIIGSRNHHLRLREKIPTEEPEITVFFHETGETKVMALETYLEGVVAAEMDPNWPAAALESQAIVARTFTLQKMNEGPLEGSGAQASTDPKEFQAYNSARVNDKVKAAVKNTRGQVITYGGEPIRAWFHSSSGGKTASASEGLNFTKERTPYVQPVVDAQQEPSHAWSCTFSAEEVMGAAKDLGLHLDQLSSVSLGRKGPSGRAETLKINKNEVSAPQFRLAVGDKVMRSTLIDTLQFENGSLYMKGRGFGHGVGMSQWGAWLLAQRGKSAREIINYYFKGVYIQDSWQ